MRTRILLVLETLAVLVSVGTAAYVRQEIREGEYQPCKESELDLPGVSSSPFLKAARDLSVRQETASCTRVITEGNSTTCGLAPPRCENTAFSCAPADAADPTGATCCVLRHTSYDEDTLEENFTLTLVNVVSVGRRPFCFPHQK